MIRRTIRGWLPWLDFLGQAQPRGVRGVPFKAEGWQAPDADDRPCLAQPKRATYVELRQRCSRLTPLAYDSMDAATLRDAARWLDGDGDVPQQVRPYLSGREREEA